MAGQRELEVLLRADQRGEHWHCTVFIGPAGRTLVFASKKRRSWGFKTREGWVHHSQYGGEA